jgi:hypothetical protein
MDDDDIEWELSKMDEAERRREAPLLRTVYRPVDPGLKARILRMFGQPYDKSAIPRGQEFYLNGWTMGKTTGGRRAGGEAAGLHGTAGRGERGQPSLMTRGRGRGGQTGGRGATAADDGGKAAGRYGAPQPGD